jgi:hypothetical protein
MATRRAKAEKDWLLRDMFARMTPAAARAVLQVKFNRRSLKVVSEMLQRNQRGMLTPEEFSELKCFIDFGDFLAILHSTARLRLKRLAESRRRRKAKPV